MNYFPIVIRYIDEKQERIIFRPEAIECKRKFRVLRTAYDNKTIIESETAFSQKEHV